jgi:glycerol-3-phosphate O-acyltransferase
VSIVHEYVPEQKSLIRELDGGKKVKENAAQVFGLVKLFSYQFGNVHINLGSPVHINESFTDLKLQTQRLAFDCFVEVGRNMRVTPTSLLAMILLDNPAGAIKWEEILSMAKNIIIHCEKFRVPMTDSLKLDRYEKSLERSIDILIGNKKVDAIQNNLGQPIFYSIKEEARKEILYFKNTILHHFLVPWIIHMAWINLFNGNIKDVEDLKKFFINQRKQLSHEFYLPTVKEFLQKALAIISEAIDREVTTLQDCMELSHKELFLILAKVSPFSRSCNYLLEAYYISGLALKDLYMDQKEGFKLDTYTKRYKDIFEAQKKMKRVIKYPESYSLPLSKSSLEYYSHSKMITTSAGFYSVADINKIDAILAEIESGLMGQLSVNLIA